MSTLPGYWSSVFATGAYDIFSPPNYTFALQRSFELLNAQPPNHILDAGCGMGSIIPIAREFLGQGGALTCIDIDEKGLKAVAKRATHLEVANRIHVAQADLTQLHQMPDTKFDGALCLFVLYALGGRDKRQICIQNIFSSLKANGRAVFAVPSLDYSAEKIIRDARKMRSKGSNLASAVLVEPLLKIWLKRLEENLSKDIFHRFSEDALKLELREVGFNITQIEKAYAGCAIIAVAEK